jgi:hypothetical protein
MKSRVTFGLVVICLACGPCLMTAQTEKLTPEQEKMADMRIPELDRSFLEPEKRTPTEVRENERNPFGFLAVAEPEEQAEVKSPVESEANKLNRTFQNMKVGGVSGSKGSYRVLLGSIALAEGDRVPQIFHDQAEQLVVDKIEDGKITLRFVERTESDAPRTPIKITFPRGLSMSNTDGGSRVRALMGGDFFLSVVKFDGDSIAMDPIPTTSAKGILESFSNEQLTEALYEGRRQLLGEIWPIRKDDVSPEQSSQ